MKQNFKLAQTRKEKELKRTIFKLSLEGKKVVRIKGLKVEDNPGYTEETCQRLNGSLGFIILSDGDGAFVKLLNSYVVGLAGVKKNAIYLRKSELEFVAKEARTIRRGSC